ncbi:MAG: hypothetical protein WA981_03770 [Glaciecola sp.]
MKTVMGVGVNDAYYVVCERKSSGERVWCPFYRRWVQMLARCYNESTIKRQPCYQSSKVCDEWLVFSSFREWMINREWKGFHLDKDILGDGSLYSPKTCAFVTRKVNNFLRKAVDGDLIYSSIKISMRGEYQAYYKGRLIGSYGCELEAKLALIANKKALAAELSKGEPDSRVRDSFPLIIEAKMKNELL